MDRERWRRIEDLYHAARSLPAGARAEFLAGQCRGDEALRSEVESLIAQPDHTWAGPGGPGQVGDEEILGKRVGHYDVQRWGGLRPLDTPAEVIRPTFPGRLPS